MLEMLFRQRLINKWGEGLLIEGLLDYSHNEMQFFLKVIIMNINYQHK